MLQDSCVTRGLVVEPGRCDLGNFLMRSTLQAQALFARYTAIIEEPTGDGI